MTEISEAAKAKADAMLKEADPRSLQDGRGNCAYWIHDAFARFIQEASDAAKVAQSALDKRLAAFDELAPFILPEPVDPLVEAISVMQSERVDSPSPTMTADRLRAELAKRGLKIVEAD